MKVYRISKCQYIDDLSGTGSANYPSRWHSKGTYILYTAANASLALLESVVHISNIIVGDYCMICLDIPENHILSVTADMLSEDWFINPPLDSLKIFGDSFVKEGKWLALKMPSAIMPEENNYLLNPRHRDFKFVKKVYSRKIAIDNRLIKEIQ